MSSSRLKTKAAADYIGKSVSWLTKSRMSGAGPVYMKVGGGVLYSVTDLDSYLAGTRRTAVYDFANDNNRVGNRDTQPVT